MTIILFIIYYLQSHTVYIHLLYNHQLSLNIQHISSEFVHILYIPSHLSGFVVKCPPREQKAPLSLLTFPGQVFVHVSVYVHMCRHVYVYEYDCFIYVHMCIRCICTYFMNMHSTLMIPLVLNYTIQIRFIIIIIVKPVT